MNTQVKLDMMARLHENQKEIESRKLAKYNNCSLEAWAKSSTASCG